MIVAPVDWFLAAVTIALLGWSFVLSRSSGAKTLSVLLAFMLAEDAVLVVLLLARVDPRVYARWYFWPGLVEGLLVAVVALEIGAGLVPKYRAVVFRWGPAVLALSIFCALAMGDGLRLAAICMRLSELMVLSSICLLCFCVAAGEVDAPGGRLARGFMVMLGVVAGASELVARSGMMGGFQLLAPVWSVELLRRLVPLSWLIGTAVLVFSLRVPGTQSGTQSRQQ